MKNPETTTRRQRPRWPGPKGRPTLQARHPDRVRPAREEGLERGTKARLTRHSCWRGESSEGWSAIGKGPRETTASLVARASAPLRGRTSQATTSARDTDREFPRERSGRAPNRDPSPPRRKDRSGDTERLGRPETWRTPGSAAGCNKPAKCQVEQAVEVGRNDKGGTNPGIGKTGSKVAPRREAESFGMKHSGSSPEQRNHWEWTPGTHVDGGADL